MHSANFERSTILHSLSSSPYKRDFHDAAVPPSPQTRCCPGQMLPRAALEQSHDWAAFSRDSKYLTPDCLFSEINSIKSIASLRQHLSLADMKATFGVQQGLRGGEVLHSKPHCTRCIRRKVRSSGFLLKP